MRVESHSVTWVRTALQLSVDLRVRIHHFCDVPSVITDGISFLIKNLHSCQFIKFHSARSCIILPFNCVEVRNTAARLLKELARETIHL